MAFTDKILTDGTLPSALAVWKEEGKSIVFTNGCFDLLHLGHVRYLESAADLGDILLIGINSDASIARLKGNDRPFVALESRMAVLAALSCVDAVVPFDADDPFELISLVQPRILVKGGDYKPNEVVGREIVLKNGGRVEILPFEPGWSTTTIAQKIVLSQKTINR